MPNFLNKNQSGTTLLELMVSVGLSGFVLLATVTVITQIEAFRARVTKEAEKENIRSLVRARISCDTPCDEMVKKIPSKFGGWQVRAYCGIQGQSDVRVSIFNDKFSTEGEAPLFELGDGGPCQPRQPNNCYYACHARGELMERGYLYPPLTAPLPSFLTADMKCPKGNPVGVDFGTGRVICANDKLFGPEGPLCKFHDGSANSKKTTFVIGGRIPCREHSQKNGMHVSVHGKIQVEFADGFIPSSHDSFAIVVGHKVSGVFSNASSELVTKLGKFNVTYSDKTITLSGFIPNQSKSLSH